MAKESVPLLKSSKKRKKKNKNKEKSKSKKISKPTDHVSTEKVKF